MVGTASTVGIASTDSTAFCKSLHLYISTSLHLYILQLLKTFTLNTGITAIKVILITIATIALSYTTIITAMIAVNVGQVGYVRYVTLRYTGVYFTQKDSCVKYTGEGVKHTGKRPQITPGSGVFQHINLHRILCKIHS